MARYSTVKERLDQNDQDGREFVTRMRAYHAATWRRARRVWRETPEPLRSIIMDKWKAGYLPGTSNYFADLVHCEHVKGL